MSIFDWRLKTGEWPNNRNSKILNRNSFCRRVPPGECGLASSNGDPGTNGVISKTRCGTPNKDQIRNFASGTLRLQPPLLSEEVLLSASAKQWSLQHAASAILI